MSVYKNDSNLTQEEKEIRFNNFLNKTIILSSKRYFKREVNISNKEQMLVDDNSHTSVLNSASNSTNNDFDLVSFFCLGFNVFHFLSNHFQRIFRKNPHIHIKSFFAGNCVYIRNVCFYFCRLKS